ncbi:MAG: radical SAM protein [Candidatus Omnitrophota bacterium]
METETPLYHNFSLSTFIITYKCPISCPMCFFAGGPDREETMDRDIALSVLEESKALGIPAIGIAGGEPFLRFELMSTLIENARNLPIIIVVTNAFWATSYDEAINKLKILQEKGLKRLQVSLDDQHQKHIPIERVANAVKAALDLGYEDVKILGSSIGNSETFKYQLFELEHFLGTPVDRTDILDRTRVSHQYFQDDHQRRFSLYEMENADALGLPIKKPGDCLSEMMLDVNHDVYPCCNNFVGRIGNASNTSFISIMKKLGNNKYFRMIKEEGPLAFARYLDRTEGTRYAEGRYGNWCELCGRIFQTETFRDLLVGECK